MNIIAVANQKGGCGKTTTAINLSASLGKKFQKTLLLDMDPQGHASLGLKQQTTNRAGLYEVLADQAALTDVIIAGVLHNVDLVPATISLAAVDHLLSGRHDREQQLQRLLEPLEAEYDYVVIDCPPSLGMLSINALRAASLVLIPVDMGLFALEGLNRLRETIDLVCARYQLDIPRRILPTMVDIRTRLARSFLEHLNETCGDELSSVYISHSVRLREAVCEGLPVIEHAAACAAAQDYMRLASEMILGIAGLELADELVRQEKCEQGEAVPEMRYATLRPVRQAADHDSGEVLLEYQGMADHDIKIAGDFNDWVPDKGVETRIVNGTLVKVLKVAPGAYQYRIVVDGDWQHDPHNPQQVENQLGGANSVLQVSA